MKVCGVVIKGSEALLAVAEVNDGEISFVATGTKKIKLGDDKAAESLKACLSAIKAFAHENDIDWFAIKARAHSGKRAGGAVSFKIETLFQLSEYPFSLVNAVALSKLAKQNIAGIPAGVLEYQKDAYRCAVFQMNKVGVL